MPRVLLSVINDVHTDNRIHRTATVFKERGYEVEVVGRTWPNPQPVDRPYSVHRFSCRRHRGAWFYLEYQIRLFRYLLKKEVDVYLANDLDTLLPMAIVSFLRKKPLIYDSHEYFCGVPELARRPGVRAVWHAVERFCMPLVTDAVTVSPPIARAYFEEYGIPFSVVRNVPMGTPGNEPIEPLNSNLAGAQADASDATGPHASFGRPDLPVVLLQGAGINVDRGAEEAVLALREVPDAQLWIVGSGDVLPELRRLVAQHQLQDRVFFHDRVPAQQLKGFTRRATVGLSLDKPSNPNYRWSLPNKVFDAFHSQLPQVVSPVEEVARLIRTHEAGWVVEEVTPTAIAAVLRRVLRDDAALARAREGARKAALRYQWSVESLGWHACLDRLEGRAPYVHMISMDAPVPPLYGGMAEVSSQLEALALGGFRTELHAFVPPRRRREVALRWMESQVAESEAAAIHLLNGTSPKPAIPSVRLWLYPRNGWSSFFQRLPYLVASRASVPLVRRLESAPTPVVVHGYHGLWSAGVSRSVARRSFLRVHNPERVYYQGLADAEPGKGLKSWIRKKYYRIEARRLVRFEQRVLPHLPLAGVWALTPGDAEAVAPFFRTPVVVIPPAVPALPQTESVWGDGAPFLLVHGKLSVAENDWAGHRWLDVWEEVVRQGRVEPNMQCVVAGQGASGALRRRAASLPRVRLVDTPSPEEMTQLLRAAAVHGQLAVHRAGIKYKLLNALQTDAPILGNRDLVAGTGAEGLIRELPEPFDPSVWADFFARHRAPLSSEEQEARRLFAAKYTVAQLASELKARLNPASSGESTAPESGSRAV